MTIEQRPLNKFYYTFLLAVSVLLFRAERVERSKFEVDAFASQKAGSSDANIVGLRKPRPDLPPAKPSLFAVVASDHSGAEWLLSQLSNHWQICVSDVLDPDLERFRNSHKDQDVSCSYAFVRDAIQEITAGFHGTNPERCNKGYDKSDDNLADHLGLLCRWIDALSENFTSDAILNQYIDAYFDNDQSLLQCSCDKPVKGLKVDTEWLPRWPVESWHPVDLNLNVTAISGSKMIYMYRRNLFARFRLRMHGETQHEEWTVNTEDMLVRNITDTSIQL